ncbi:MAG TPA: segregation/condensation protein A, partial [Pyrinomonadaceae bacterium]|nr:segregation/condensation protein A [Pyrinomonadaceae bacterium]
MAEMNELKERDAEPAEGVTDAVVADASDALVAEASSAVAGSPLAAVGGEDTPASESPSTDSSETTPSLNVAGARPEIVSEGGEGGEELKLYLGEFAGPLDLLLYLIRQEQVDIYDIPIARITDEYLRYLRLMQDMDIAVASEFLVMAAQLIEIKSKMLRPPDPVADAAQAEGEDPRSELIKQLLEHQKFKAAAQMLWSRSTVEQAVYVRAPIETDKSN